MTMATYSVTINEKTAMGKSILKILQSASGIVTITPQNAERSLDSLLLDQITSGAREALDIKAGKIKGKSIDMLLNE
jgi:hypothetical protein